MHTKAKIKKRNLCNVCDDKSNSSKQMWDAEAVWLQHPIPALSVEATALVIAVAKHNYRGASSLAMQKPIPKFLEIISLPPPSQ